MVTITMRYISKLLPDRRYFYTADEKDIHTKHDLQITEKNLIAKKAASLVKLKQKVQGYGFPNTVF